MNKIDAQQDFRTLLAGVIDYTDDGATPAQSTSKLRTSLTGSTDIEISHSDGDSITAYDPSSPQTAAVTSASTGTVVAAFSVAGMSSVALYTETTSTIVGAQACTLQVSPSDASTTDWVATSATITPSTTNAVTVLTAPVAIRARRARVVIAAAITSGTFNISAVAG